MMNNTVAARKETLKENGINNMFISFGDMINIQNEQRDLSDYIKSDDYTKSSHLYRRWVMSQMYRMCRIRRNNYISSQGLQDASNQYRWHLNQFNNKYKLNVMLNELKACVKMEQERDSECSIRKQFFTKEVVSKTLLEMYESNRSGYYWTLNEKGDIESATKDLVTAVNCTMLYQQYKKIYAKLVKFYRYPEKSINMHQLFITPEFDKAYTAAGAYYTLQNLVRFHGCKIRDPEESQNKVLNNLFMNYVVSNSPDELFDTMLSVMLSGQYTFASDF